MSEHRCPFCQASLPTSPEGVTLTCPGCGRFVTTGRSGGVGAKVLVAVIGALFLAGIGGGVAVILGQSTPATPAAEPVTVTDEGDEAPDLSAAVDPGPREEIEIGGGKIDLSGLDEPTRRQLREAQAQIRRAEEEARRLQEALAARNGQPSPESPEPPAEAPLPVPSRAPPPAAAPAKPQPQVTTRVMGTTDGLKGGVAGRLFDGSRAAFLRCFAEARASCANCVRGFGGTVMVFGGADGRVTKVEAVVGPHRTFGDKLAQGAADKFGACVEQALARTVYPAGKQPFKATHQLLVRVSE